MAVDGRFPGSWLTAATGFWRSDFHALDRYLKLSCLWKVATGSNDQSTSWIIDRRSAGDLGSLRDALASSATPGEWLEGLADEAVAVFWEAQKPTGTKVVSSDPRKTEPARMSDLGADGHPHQRRRNLQPARVVLAAVSRRPIARPVS